MLKNKYIYWLSACKYYLHNNNNFIHKVIKFKILTNNNTRSFVTCLSFANNNSYNMASRFGEKLGLNGPTRKELSLQKGRAFALALEEGTPSYFSSPKLGIKGIFRLQGHNNTGQKTTRHRGGGHKKRYRLITNPGVLIGGTYVVINIEYDPFRTSNIALVRPLYSPESYSYILASEDLIVGTVFHVGFYPNLVSVTDNMMKTSHNNNKDKVWEGGEEMLYHDGNYIGNLSSFKAGSLINNIGGKYIKAGGTYGMILKRENNKVLVKLPSTELKWFNENMVCSLGKLSKRGLRFTLNKTIKYVKGHYPNDSSKEAAKIFSNNIMDYDLKEKANIYKENLKRIKKEKQKSKAGVSRWKGIRPTVRGEAMNAGEHPHGGKTSGGRIPRTPWGKLAKGPHKLVVSDRTPNYGN